MGHSESKPDTEQLVPLPIYERYARGGKLPPSLSVQSSIGPNTSSSAPTTPSYPHPAVHPVPATSSSNSLLPTGKKGHGRSMTEGQVRAMPSAFGPTQPPMFPKRNSNPASSHPHSDPTFDPLLSDRHPPQTPVEPPAPAPHARTASSSAVLSRPPPTNTLGRNESKKFGVRRRTQSLGTQDASAEPKASVSSTGTKVGEEAVASLRKVVQELKAGPRLRVDHEAAERLVTCRDSTSAQPEKSKSHGRSRSSSQGRTRKNSMTNVFKPSHKGNLSTPNSPSTPTTQGTTRKPEPQPGVRIAEEQQGEQRRPWWRRNGSAPVHGVQGEQQGINDPLPSDEAVLHTAVPRQRQVSEPVKKRPRSSTFTMISLEFDYPQALAALDVASARGIPNEPLAQPQGLGQAQGQQQGAAPPTQALQVLTPKAAPLPTPPIRKPGSSPHAGSPPSAHGPVGSLHAGSPPSAHRPLPSVPSPVMAQRPLPSIPSTDTPKRNVSIAFTTTPIRSPTSTKPGLHLDQPRNGDAMYGPNYGLNGMVLPEKTNSSSTHQAPEVQFRDYAARNGAAKTEPPASPSTRLPASPEQVLARDEAPPSLDAAQGDSASSRTAVSPEAGHGVPAAQMKITPIAPALQSSADSYVLSPGGNPLSADARAMHSPTVDSTAKPPSPMIPTVAPAPPTPSATAPTMSPQTNSEEAEALADADHFSHEHEADTLSVLGPVRRRINLTASLSRPTSSASPPPLSYDDVEVRQHLAVQSGSRLSEALMDLSRFQPGEDCNWQEYVRAVAPPDPTDPTKVEKELPSVPPTAPTSFEPRVPPAHRVSVALSAMEDEYISALPHPGVQHTEPEQDVARLSSVLPSQMVLSSKGTKTSGSTTPSTTETFGLPGLPGLPGCFPPSPPSGRQPPSPPVESSLSTHQPLSLPTEGSSLPMVQEPIPASPVPPFKVPSDVDVQEEPSPLDGASYELPTQHVLRGGTQASLAALHALEREQRKVRKTQRRFTGRSEGKGLTDGASPTVPRVDISPSPQVGNSADVLPPISGPIEGLTVETGSSGSDQRLETASITPEVDLHRFVGQELLNQAPESVLSDALGTSPRPLSASILPRGSSGPRASSGSHASYTTSARSPQSLPTLTLSGDPLPVPGQVTQPDPSRPLPPIPPRSTSLTREATGPGTRERPGEGEAPDIQLERLNLALPTIPSSPHTLYSTMVHLGRSSSADTRQKVDAASVLGPQRVGHPPGRSASGQTTSAQGSDTSPPTASKPETETVLPSGLVGPELNEVESGPAAHQAPTNVQHHSSHSHSRSRSRSHSHSHSKRHRNRREKRGYLPDDILAWQATTLPTKDPGTPVF